MKMGSKMHQRKFLSSAREVSMERLLKVQDALVSDDCKADCLLIITGIDSRFNIGSKNALEVMLPGIADYQNTPTKLSEETFEDAVDDLVICIKKASVVIYCNPKNYDVVMSYAASWNNLSINCLDENQYQNHEDLSEDLKMKSFVEMVNGCQCVAIPYNYGIAKEYQTVPFDAMLVEKWPLIQAFALEDVGGGGFFTMMHQVVDATSLLNGAFSSLDPLSFEILVTKHLSQFEKQWMSLIDNVSMACENDAGNIESSTVAEPLTTYYHHASIERHNYDVREPFVQFGVHTSNHRSGNPVGQKMLLKNSGVKESQGYHMVCSGKDSKGIISCTRTFFFEASKENSEEKKLAKSEEDLTAKDIRRLANCYLLAVEAFDLAVDEFTKNLDPEKCNEVITKYILQEAQLKKLSFIPGASNIGLLWHSFDYNGRRSSPSNGYFHNIEISMNDIPSMKHDGESLGSVCFSDTFLTSTIRLKDDSHNTENLILTQTVKRFITWQISKPESLFANVEKISEDKNLEALLGNCLIESSTAILIHGKWPVFYTDEVVFYGFEKELVLHHNQSGYVSIRCNDIVQWTVFDNDSTASITMLCIKPNETLMSCLPFWFSRDEMVLLAFLPRSKAHSAFYDKAFHVWKELKNNPLKSCDDLPDDIKAIYNSVENRFKSAEEKELSLARQFKEHPKIKRYFNHLQLSSNIRYPLGEKEMQIMLSEGKENQIDQIAPDDSELMLTILTGLPGSGSEALCKSLVSLAREASRWLAIKVPCDIKVPFSAQAFQEQLSFTYRSITQRKGRPQASSRKRRRLLIETQGFVDVRDVIYAIQEHPDQHLRSKLKIGSVTCCINPYSTYLCGKMQMPFLLEQCSPGFVNHALFTSCLEPEKADILTSCQKLIRYCNPEVSFLIAKGGEISRTPDVELVLSDNAFEDYRALRARKMFNFNRCILSRKSLNQVTIPFKKPLDKSMFLSSLKDMTGKHGFNDNLKAIVLYMEGKVPFVDYTDAYDFKWSKLLGMTSFRVVSNQLSPRPPSSKKDASKEDERDKNFFVTFFGMEVENEGLQNMMQSWTQQRKLPLNRADIPKEKLDEIANSHKFDVLPAGWFFNGTQFVSFGGDKQSNHPLFDSYVDEYIAKLNQDIDSFNEKIDSKGLFAN